MEQRTIGQLSVSVVGVGCNNFGGRIGPDETAAVVEAAIDSGVNFFDTADVYGNGQSEELLGAALGNRRDDVVIATKFGAMADEGHRRGSPEWIAIAAERSLKKLGTDRIDLYQFHVPDPDVPLEETLGALDELVVAGKVREIGCSNAGSTLLRDATAIATERGLAPYRTVQNRYSVLTRDPEPKVLPACAELGIGLIPYLPLEAGLLTGKVRSLDELPEGTRLAGMDHENRSRFLDADSFATVQQLDEYARQHDATLLGLAMSWLVANQHVVSVIAGATKPEQMRANASAAQEWTMTPQNLEDIDAIVGTA